MGVGCELYKRPGLGAFLNKVSQSYEVCIFGMTDGHEVQEVCESLDPKQQIFRGAFGRESTALSKDGKYVKDLSYLNRNLKDVIYIDFQDDQVIY